MKYSIVASLLIFIIGLQIDARAGEMCRFLMSRADALN